MPTLVAAEADRIQDLIFRSSRLREVTGGSFALERFWTHAAEAAGRRGARVLVAAGGTFRAVFDSDRDAPGEFARDLQDAYAREMGGGLTTVLVAGSNDPELLKHASASLAREKLRGDAPAAAIHFPYLQPCDSCARDLASERVALGEGDHQDLCRICAGRRRERDRFQEAFLERVGEIGPSGSRVLKTLPDEANEVGSLDSRARVAYLLADGNGFGRYFGAALESGDLDVYTDLSRTVSEAGATALAEATAVLAKGVPRLPDGKAPVLPLITGGDDIFALLPAPWALEFARVFADAFVTRMRKAKLFEEYPALNPSISCALVICKATFPYRFAHHAGDDALKEAKRMARLHPGVSVVRAVELRATAGSPAGPPREYGVFALDVPGAPETPLLGARQLVSVRTELGPRIAGKRRHQIEALYAADEHGSDGWIARRDRILARMEGGDAAKEELERLVSDQADGERSAVPDLFHLWDYLERLAAEGGKEGR